MKNKKYLVDCSIEFHLIVAYTLGGPTLLSFSADVHPISKNSFTMKVLVDCSVKFMVIVVYMLGGPTLLSCFKYFSTKYPVDCHFYKVSS